MLKFRIMVTVFLSTFISVNSAYSDEVNSVHGRSTSIQPYRTFITLQKYSIENNGEKAQPISNVRLEVTFPNGSKVQLPENGQYWPIGNGQSQEINRSFELPWAFIQNDSFRFKIQMIRHGGTMLPCEFDVTTLSQFNRSYVCHTDVGWQTNQKIAAEKQDKEGVQIRVFTDRNSQPNEIPQDTLAIR